MKKILFAFIALAMIGCSSASPDAGQEAVFVMNPVFFGHGGIDPTPVSTGKEYCAISTSVVYFPIVPLTVTEDFTDMMTSDNTPVAFHSYLKVQIQKGNTPALLTKFGEKWYANSVAPWFRTFVRDKVSSHKMFDLTSNRKILAEIEQSILQQTKDYCANLKLPVDILEVTIGAVTPPPEVLEESRETAAQNQSRLTQGARAAAELSRKQAEINKAIADKAYQTQMSMTTNEYLQLRALEIMASKGNVSFVMGGAQPMFGIR